MLRCRDRFFIFLAGAALVTEAACAQFALAHLDPAVGRVGYHLDIGVLFYKGDAPKGNSGGTVSGTCAAEWTNATYSGALPPGVKFLAQTGRTYSIFSGTPRQTGTWRGSLSVDLHCTGGPNTNFYHRTIPVAFTIDP